MDWSAFTKGYFLNRETLVAVLLLIDASVPPQKIDLDCANWLGRNNVCSYPISILFSLEILAMHEVTSCSSSRLWWVYVFSFRYQLPLFSQNATRWKGVKGKDLMKTSEIFKRWWEKIIRNILRGSWPAVPLVWAGMSFFCIYHSCGTIGTSRNGKFQNLELLNFC